MVKFGHVVSQTHVVISHYACRINRDVKFHVFFSILTLKLSLKISLASIITQSNICEWPSSCHCLALPAHTKLAATACCRRCSCCPFAKHSITPRLRDLGLLTVEFSRLRSRSAEIAFASDSRSYDAISSSLRRSTRSADWRCCLGSSLHGST